jgi:hypothetical protein
MSIDIEEQDVESRVTPNNGKANSSISEAKNVTPTGVVKKQLHFGCNDPMETLIHSTKSIQLMTTSPSKRITSPCKRMVSPCKRSPSKQHHTLTSINKPKDKFTRLDEHNEIEFVYSNYFNVRESS